MEHSRLFIERLPEHISQTVKVADWVYRLRVHAKTTFLVLKDATGLVQCVLKNELLKDQSLHLEEVVELTCQVVSEPRAPQRRLWSYGS